MKIDRKMVDNEFNYTSYNIRWPSFLQWFFAYASILFIRLTLTTPGAIDLSADFITII